MKNRVSYIFIVSFLTVLCSANARAENYLSPDIRKNFLVNFKINSSNNSEIDRLALDQVCERFTKEKFADIFHLHAQSFAHNFQSTKDIYHNGLNNLSKAIDKRMSEECALPKDQRNKIKIANICLVENKRITKHPNIIFVKDYAHLCLQYMNTLKMSYESTLDGINAFKKVSTPNNNDCSGAVSNNMRKAKPFTHETNPVTPLMENVLR